MAGLAAFSSGTRWPSHWFSTTKERCRACSASWAAVVVVEFRCSQNDPPDAAGGAGAASAVAVGVGVGGGVGVGVGVWAWVWVGGAAAGGGAVRAGDRPSPTATATTTARPST